MRNYRLYTILSVALILTLGMCATSCSDDDDSGPAFSVRLDPGTTIHPDQEGAVVLIVTGRDGTPWTAEIVSGGEWTSFDRFTPGGQLVKSGVVGSSLAARNQYVYYWPNDTNGSRTATIRFTFAGQTPVELELMQYSTSSDDDVYQTGQYKAWPEIPAQVVNADYLYITHFARFRNYDEGTMYNARNYTMCFDKTKFGAWWVAYPLHTSYTGTGRVESWAYDPKIAGQYQPDLARSYPSSTYDRGHQIPNADRNGNSVMQAQTFYFSNITPQNARLNQQPWGALEKMARDDWMCSDTLYVVTGAWWRPGSGVTTPDRNGKLCPVPTSYFKVLVRTVAGDVRQTGDRLGDYPPSQLKSIGFWVDNLSGQGTARDWVKSVAEIEQMTGFSFFPSVPAQVKAQTDPASWGL